MIPYLEFNKVVFRIPQLSFSEYTAVLKSKDYLYKKFEDPVFQEAIYIASPLLYQELIKLLKSSNHEESDGKIENSLIRYLTRMSTRCTPFGLFSGYLIGNINKISKVELDQKINIIPRLDNSIVCAIHDNIFENLDKRKVLYFPNPTLYRIGQNIRYYECTDIQNGKTSISQVINNKLLSEILKLSEGGCNIPFLASFLVSKGFQKEESYEFIVDLIDNQVLLDEIYYSSIGCDYFSRIMDLVEKIGDNSIKIHLLKKIQEIFNAVKTQTSRDRVDSYKKIEEHLNFSKISIPNLGQSLIQIEYFKSGKQSAVGHVIIEELKLVMKFLNKTTTKIEHTDQSNFYRGFIERYEQQKIPLLEALDPDIGIGYPIGKNYGHSSSLIDDLNLHEEKKHNVGFDSMLHLLRKKNNEALSKGEFEIEFTDRDVKGFVEDWSDLPDTIFAIFELIRHKDDNILINLKGINGMSGANLLSRFCHCDLALLTLVRNITKKEQELNQDVILAEIVHVSEAKLGNVASRPHIRDFEIICSGYSDLPSEQKISVNDLYIFVENNELFLFSKKHNKRVIPRLTNAHNYKISDSPIYRFLCDLQAQNIRSSLQFKNFEQNKEFSSFQPRIKYRNVILSPANWYMVKEDFKDIISSVIDDKLLILIGEWRLKHSIPRFVLINERGIELFIDWENLLNIKSIMGILKKEKSLRLYEFLFTKEDAIVEDIKGSFLNEIIVPFYKNKIVNGN